MIITVDGPAGTGKTTVAKRVAERLRFSYFDTGAMYRAVTWLILQKRIELSDEKNIKTLLETLSFSIKEGERERHYFIGEQEITQEIRSQVINENVSAVSALPVIREALWKIQKGFAKQGNAVFEGRDLGTVVFPEAELKVFLTARPEIRAKRRLDEILAKNSEQAKTLNQEKILADLMRRDDLDSSRNLAPLKCPDDALVIDTSFLSIDEVVDQILKYKLTIQPI